MTRALPIAEFVLGPAVVPRRVVAVLALFAALAVNAPAAHANVTLEIYWADHPRPKGANGVMDALGEQMKHQFGYWFSRPRDVAANLYYRRVPIQHDPKITGEAIVSQFQFGERQFQHADPDALKVLQAAEKMAEDNGPAVAAIDNLQKTRAGALVALAQGLASNGDQAGAIAAMSELGRIYPDITVTAPEYTNDQADLFARARAAQAKLGSGVLRVHAPDCDVYVDEVHRGKDDVELVEATGSYRVLVRHGDRWWRFDADIGAGKTVAIKVDWALQGVLAWSPDWFGLQLPEHDPDELAHYQQISDMFGGTATLGLVSMQSSDSGVVLVGRLYDPKTRRLTQQVATRLGTDEDAERITAMAGFLATGAMSPYFEPLPVESGPPRVEPRRSQVHAGALSISLLSIGGAAIAGGATAIALGHPSNDVKGSALDNLRIPGALLLDAGVAVAGLGTYVLLRKNDRMWPVAIGVAAAVALIPAGAWYVHINPDAACALGERTCAYVNGTNVLGWSMIGAGVAGAGLAIGWYAYERTHPHARHENRPPAAAIVPTRGGAFVSLGGTF